MFLNKLKYLLSLAFCLFLVEQKAEAQNLWGSGAMQGGMICPYESRVAKNGVDVSDEEKEAKKEIVKLKKESADVKSKKRLTEDRLKMLRRDIERYFDSEVSEFLLDTHIESDKYCNQYKSFANGCYSKPAPAPAAGDTAAKVTPAAPKAECDNLDDVPDKLQKRWNDRDGNKGPYCVGSSRSNAGSVAVAICSDETLKPEGSKRGVSASACSKSLSEYRKMRKELATLATKEENLKFEIEDKDYAISNARERARMEREYRIRNETEGECEECDAYNRGYGYQRPKRDWVSTGVHVLGGVALALAGKRAEEAHADLYAQSGIYSNERYGLPYYVAGMGSVINGLVGPGAYGCASAGGAGGFQLGPNSGLNGILGPYGANGGAFSYPQNMFGTPWGGGMFNPGINLNGGLNGPFGGLGPNGLMYPNNGNMAMCFTWPCNVGQGNGNPFFNGNMGGQWPPSQFPGLPGANGNFGLNGQLSYQYQMQMQQMQMQMQMQMQQQQMQMQQQYAQQMYQYQMQAYQQAQARQQQAMQIQMQMQQLNAQLQQLYYSNNYGLNGGASGGAGFNFGLNFGLNVGGNMAPAPGGFNAGWNLNYPGIPTNPGYPNPGYPNPGYPNPGYPNPGYPNNGGGSRGR